MHAANTSRFHGWAVSGAVVQLRPLPSVASPAVLRPLGHFDEPLPGHRPPRRPAHPDAPRRCVSLSSLSRNHTRLPGAFAFLEFSRPLGTTQAARSVGSWARSPSSFLGTLTPTWYSKYAPYYVRLWPWRGAVLTRGQNVREGVTGGLSRFPVGHDTAHGHGRRHHHRVDQRFDVPHLPLSHTPCCSSLPSCCFYVRQSLCTFCRLSLPASSPSGSAIC